MLPIWRPDLEGLHKVAFAKTDCGEEFTGSSPIASDLLARMGGIQKVPA